MDVKEAKQRALRLMREKGMDLTLIKTYQAIKHYPSWAERDDFNEKWNIGLGDISGEEVTLEVGYLKDCCRLTVAEIDGVKFKIGGFAKFDVMPDGSSLDMEAVALYVDGKCVIAALYSRNGVDAILPSDFRLSSVEEFHQSAVAEQVLQSVSNLIDRWQAKKKVASHESDVAKYEGKFSFGDE